MVQTTGWPLLLLRVLVFLMPVAMGCGNPETGAGVPPPPGVASANTVQAWVMEAQLRLGRSRSTKFRIAVRIPPNHHGYLDTGDGGLLIPLTFTFMPLEQRGARVAVLARPRGTRDEKFRATVLRGTGTFGFRLEATSDIFLPGSVLPATLRYQICNDVTNICYAPKEIDVPLRFAER